MNPSLFADISTTLEQLANLIPANLRSNISINEQFIWNRIIPAIAIFWIGKWVLRIAIRQLTRAMDRFHVDRTLAKFISTVGYYAGLILVVIAAANQLGLPTQQLTAIVAASGLAVGLALKDSLSNFAAGVMIILFRPFEVDDVIEVAGTKGKVEAIHVFNTILNSADNVKTYVPNGSILSGNITNFSRERFRRIDLEVGCGYGDDLPRVKQFLESTLENHPLVLADPAPVVAVHELADSCVTFVVRPWVVNADYWKVRWDLIEQIKLGFDAHGFEIPFPQRTIHMVEEAATSTSGMRPQAGHVESAERHAEQHFPVQPRRVA